ncbi:MAG TPA: PAS domain-containing protein, partial [Burkholderiales bacterium]|nr:PAS domain-containing protein [Burkholderiales bacterium]
FSVRESADVIGLMVAYLTGLAVAAASALAAFGFRTADIAQRRERERAEQLEALNRRLHEQRELLQVTLASIGDGVIATDKQCNVVFLNDVAQALTGWKQSEATGMPLQNVVDIVDERTRAPTENPCVRAMRDGVVVGLANHTILIARDGTEVALDDSAAPIRDGAGNVVGAVLIFRDVTERRRTDERLRESQERFQAFMDHTPTRAWIKDEEGRYLYRNPASERVLGKTAEQYLGRTDYELFPRELAEQFVANDAAVLASGRSQRFVEISRVNDQERRILVVKFPIRLAGRRCVAGVAIDLTEQLQVEEALRAADRRKDEFLATLAHELRNPLNPLRNAAAILRHAESGDADAAWARDVIDRQVAQMARLLDDLLDVSRITLNRLELRKQPVVLAEVVEHAVETSRPLMDQAGHTLLVHLPEEPVQLDADPVRLAQVFSNLLNNAAKYTPPGGHITLGARVLPNEVEITVRDDGIGIEPGHLPHVFEMFSQVKSAAAHSQGGLGIGLSLVKSLVEMHGGTVAARSAGNGRGSEFLVRLPRSVLAPRDAPRQSEQAQLRDARKILVVDDNRDSADSTAVLLGLQGHDVRRAYDGETALEEAQAFHPHLVLLDIGLPRLDGYEVGRRLRQEPWGKACMLVAMTGWGQDEDKLRALQSGFDRHMTKPVDIVQLSEVLAELGRGGRDAWPPPAA